MAQSAFQIEEYKKRMDGAIAALRHEFSGLRTGRASATLLDSVMVEAYGAMTPLNQVAGVNAPEPRMLVVQIWDRGVTSAVEKAIRASGLGLNPVVDGQTLRVPIPPLSGERRTELAKIAGKHAEASRVAIRQVRRDAMDHLKKLEKDGAISEDEHKKLSDQVQKETDAFIKRADEALKQKEEEIMQV